MRLVARDGGDALDEIEDGLGRTAFLGQHRVDNLAALGLGEAAPAQAFIVAYKLKPKPLILFNIGQAYRKMGALDGALAYYQRFLKEAPASERPSGERPSVARTTPTVRLAAVRR